MAKFSCHGSLLAWNAWCCLVLAGHAVASEREWPRYAHDQALTGRTSLRGDISQPRAAWSLSLAGENLTIELRPAAKDGTSCRYRTRRPLPPKNEPLATTGPLQLDIDGTGTLRDAREALSLRYARILSDVPGYQQVTWNETWNTAKICRLQLFAFDQGFDKPTARLGE